MVDLESKFRGALVGSALGDAVGELAFSCSTRQSLCDQIMASKQLRYTDDTAMAIAMAESLIDKGDLDAQHLGDTFNAHYRNEPWRGYGPGPPRIFERVQQQGCSYAQAARMLYGGEGSLGNGAAMRIAPLAVLCYESGDLYDRARLSAEVTHTHAVGIDGAAVQAAAVALAVTLDPDRALDRRSFLDSLTGQCRTPEMADKLVRVEWMLNNARSPAEAAAEFGHSVAVHESEPFAVFCFLHHPNSFVECILCASLNGGDRDTMAAMAGAISGAYLGCEALPAEWLRRLENRERIQSLAHALYGLHQG
jgi:poly(ADP-ribose) glycohydrolase ARH3